MNNLEHIINQAATNPNLETAKPLYEALKHIAHTPDNDLKLRSLQALALYGLGQYDQAIDILEAILVDYNNDIEALSNLALLYPLAGKAEKAIDIAIYLIGRRNNNPTFWDHLGYAQLNNGLYSQAANSFHRAIQIIPLSDNPDEGNGKFHFRLYHTNRFLGEHEQAHYYLCERLKDPKYKESLGLPASTNHDVIPCWTSDDGWDIQQKNILIWRENSEGIGDDILVLQHLAQYPSIFFTKNHYSMTIDKRLTSIAQHILPHITLISHDNKAPSYIDADIDIMILSLHVPYFLWQHRPSYPFKKIWHAPSYMAERTSLIKQQLRDYFGDKTLIGFSWRTNNVIFQKRRSVPDSDLFILQHITDSVFINLQYDATYDEVKNIANLHYLSGIDVRHDIVSTLCLIQALDGVITSSNTVAHLAGFSGTPTCLLGAKSSMSRWACDEKPARLYSNMMIFNPVNYGEYQYPLWSACIYITSYNQTKTAHEYSDLFFHYAIEHLDNDIKLAEYFLQQSISFDPSNHPSHAQIACIYFDSNRYKLAIEHSKKAIDNYVDSKKLYYIASESMRETKDYNSQIDIAQQGHILFPDDEYFIGTQAESLVMTGKSDKALQLYEQHIVKPDISNQMYESYINQLEKTGQLDKAWALYRLFEQRIPTPPQDMLQKVALSLHLGTGDHRNYLAHWMACYPSYKEAIPDAACSNIIFAMFSAIGMQDWDKAEELETLRWHHNEQQTKHPFNATPPLSYRHYAPNELQGKTVIMWLERIEGIGDVFFHARWFSYIINILGAHMVLVGDSRFNSLASRLFGDNITIINEDFPYIRAQSYKVDYQLSGLRIFIWGMRYIGYDNAPLPYLFGSDGITMQLQKFMTKKWPNKKLIGLSWRTMNPHFYTKRIIELSLFEPLFARDDVVIINLQYGDNAEEIQQFTDTTGHILHAFKHLDIMTNFNALTSAIPLCDYIISIDNSTAIMAGALNVHGTVLLNKNANYRWFYDDARSSYYPNLRLVRQQQFTQWRDEVHQAITHAHHHIDSLK